MLIKNLKKDKILFVMKKNKFTFFFLNSFFYASTTFLSISILAKNLDILYYGQLATLMTICSIILPFVTLKVDQLWLKEIDENDNDFKFAFYLRRIIYNFLLVVIPLFFLFKYISDGFMALIMTVYFFSLICYDFMNVYSLKRKNYSLINKINFNTSILRVSLLFFVMLSPLMYKSHLFLLIFVLPTFIYLLIFVKKILNNKNNKKYKFQLKKTIHFFIASLLSIIYYQSDILMLSIIKGEEATALYHVSFICLMVIYFFPNALFQRFLLPRFHELSNERNKNLKEFIVKNQLKLFLVSILIFLLVLFLSKPLIYLFFGVKYEESVKLLYILAIGIPFYYMSFLYGAYLTTKDFIKSKVNYMLIAAVLNIILNLVFIPIYGAMGASYSTVISIFCLFFLYRNGFKSL